MVRAFWAIIGVLALILGLIGVFLPLIPTTPFILVAAAAFAKSSERLNNYLLTHKYFGPMILDWKENRRIPRKALIIKLVVMALVISLSMYFYFN